MKTILSTDYDYFCIHLSRIELENKDIVIGLY